MTEAVIFPEMAEAGAQAIAECQERGGSEVEIAIAVYLAMSAVYELRVLRDQHATRH